MPMTRRCLDKSRHWQAKFQTQQQVRKVFTQGRQLVVQEIKLPVAIPSPGIVKPLSLHARAFSYIQDRSCNARHVRRAFHKEQNHFTCHWDERKTNRESKRIKLRDKDRTQMEKIRQKRTFDPRSRWHSVDVILDYTVGNGSSSTKIDPEFSTNRETPYGFLRNKWARDQTHWNASRFGNAGKGKENQGAELHEY